MEAGRLLAFGLVAAVLIAVPGPSVLFIVTRALSYGRVPALLTVVGNSAGEFLQVLAVAVGVGALVERSLLAFSALKLLGAAYLIYLGVRTYRHRHQLLPQMVGQGQVTTRRRLLLEGGVVGATNPKSAVFFVAVLPQFVVPATGGVALQLLTLGLIWVCLALISDSVWALSASEARRWLERSPRRLAAVGGVSGVVTAGLGIGLALTGSRN